MNTEAFEIKDRWSGEVKFTAQIECAPDELPTVKLGLAVKVAVKAGAYLDGANLAGAHLDGADLAGAYLDGAYLDGANLAGAHLDGADLDGAYLDGAKIIRLVARVTRSDGYEFFAWEREDRPLTIRAGCRWFTIAEFRAHVASAYPDTDKARETLDILDYVEKRAAAFAPVIAPADVA